MDVEIRAAEELDHHAIAGLIGELGYNLDDHELGTRLQAASTNDDVVLVAVAGGRVVGMIAAAVIPMLAEANMAVRITALSVTTSVRNKGVGRALVAAVERHARYIGAEVVEAGSGRRPERLAAHRLYRALGYVDTDPTTARFWKWFTSAADGRRPDPQQQSGSLGLGQGSVAAWNWFDRSGRDAGPPPAMRRRSVAQPWLPHAMRPSGVARALDLVDGERGAR